MNDVPEKRDFNSKRTSSSFSGQSIGTRNWISRQKGYLKPAPHHHHPHSSSFILYKIILSSLFLCLVLSSSHSSSYEYLPYHHSHHSHHCLVHPQEFWQKSMKGNRFTFRKPTQKECLNECPAESTVMWTSFRSLVFCSHFPGAKQDKGVWNVLALTIHMKLPPFFWGGDLLSYYSTLACSLCPASVTSFTSPGVQNQLGERNEPPLYEWLKTSVVRQLKFLAMQGNRSGAIAEWWPLWAWFKNVSGV